MQTDTRIWEVFDDNQVSLGHFLYGDMIKCFGSEFCVIIALAYGKLNELGYTYKVVGNVYPLDENSSNPAVQQIKDKFKKRERKKLNKLKRKSGYNFQDIIKIGKYKDHNKTIKWIIDNDPAYWKWIIENKVLLLHPDLETKVNT